MSNVEEGSDLIDYIYFDVDNKCIVDTYEELKTIYYKGIKTVHENWYNVGKEPMQILRSMSSTQETLLTLKLKLYWMGNYTYLGKLKTNPK